MKRWFAGIALLLAPLLSACGTTAPAPSGPLVWGHAVAGNLTISQGWVASVNMGGMDMTSMPKMVMDTETVAYLTIKNSGAKDALVAVSTPVAVEATLHNTVSNADHSSGTMTSVSSIEIPAHGRATLTTGGQHIMLSGLKGANYDPGSRITLTLSFRSGTTIEVSMPVINIVDRPSAQP